MKNAVKAQSPPIHISSSDWLGAEVQSELRDQDP
jgi:hypothetical protein